MVRRCWSCAPEKAGAPCDAGGRTMIWMLRQGVLADRIAVPLKKALRFVWRAAAEDLSQSDQGRAAGESLL